MSYSPHFNLPHLLKFIISQPRLVKLLRSMLLSRLNLTTLSALTCNSSFIGAKIRCLEHVSTEEILKKLQSS